MLSEYDTVIFSGNCLDALRHVRKDAKKIYYCHTPPRYLFDFQDQYLSKIPFFIRPIFRAIFARHAAIYRRQLQQFDTIFTNSQNVHDRLLRFCSQESEVLYPPTDVHRFAPKQVGKHFLHHDDIEIEDSGKKYFDSYYLSFSRLSPPKRVDLIIDAFIQMPDENLILTYGKNDPLKNKILKAIEGKSNIHAIESPTDTELIDLIRWATATVYIPIDEDFGMAPVESMACGTPVIGVNEWGLRETIIHNQTGKLIDIPDHDTWVARLQELILSSSKEDWKHMHGDCILRALDFSLEKFEKRLQSL